MQNQTTATTGQNWQVNARFKQMRLASEGRAAADAARAIADEIAALTYRKNRVDQLLRDAKSNRAVLAQTRPGDARLDVLAAEANNLTVELEQITGALADAKSRHEAANREYNTRQKLAYDAKMALQATGMGEI